MNENTEMADKIKERYFLRAVEKPGIYLHVGCGDDIREGFVNIDSYAAGRGQVSQDIRNISYPADTVDGIVSIHSLEHIPIRDATRCLHGWYKFLKPDGWLFLMIPDLGECVRILEGPYLTRLEAYWYRYCIFGYQTDPAEDKLDMNCNFNPAQLHMTGWTKNLIQRDLCDAGFTIERMFNYDGIDTPSLCVEAFKRMKPAT